LSVAAWSATVTDGDIVTDTAVTVASATGQASQTRGNPPVLGFGGRALECRTAFAVHLVDDFRPVQHRARGRLLKQAVEHLALTLVDRAEHLLLGGRERELSPSRVASRLR
jgi:hypothetical protein